MKWADQFFAKLIEVEYSCRACKLQDVKIKVFARKENQDIGNWLDKDLYTALAADHFNRSPNCITEELNNVKIPLGKGDVVGAPKD